MRSGRFAARQIALLTILVCALASPALTAQTEQVLHSFTTDYQRGLFPYSALVLDKAGNLYGTTLDGGVNSAGAVFELSPKPGGGWSEKVLHSFANDGQDAFNPYGALIFDSSGNLYGTSFYGGANGSGAVYQLKPRVGGGWTESVIHSFNYQGPDGANPAAGLILDAGANLYGTTVNGGNRTVGRCYGGGCGIVFELSPQLNGTWSETILYTFVDDLGSDGAVPWSPVVFDSTGNLYGTTDGGGTYEEGTVYELSPSASGQWTEAILHNFNANGVDGEFPQAGLTLDSAGNLYGTTTRGGAYNNNGIVFELSPVSGGWTETVIHSFGLSGDGAYPEFALLTPDPAGNLYGTTTAGGTSHGLVFKLTPSADGGWTESVFYEFSSHDGWYPQSGVVFDDRGNLYGTTLQAGKNGYGTVYEITP